MVMRHAGRAESAAFGRKLRLLFNVRNAARALPFRLSLLRTDRCTVRIVFSSRSKTRKLPELNDPWNSFQRLSMMCRFHSAH